MSNKNKMKVLRILVLIITILLFIGMIIYMLPFMQDLVTEQGRADFANEIQKAGIGGVFMIFGIECAQVFFVVLPAEPVAILAGMCYGSVWGTVLIMISAAFISIIIVLLVRKFEKSFIYTFCSEERIKKIENSQMFKNENNIEIIMLILFLIPGTPKDLLVYIAGLLPIKPSRFLVISSIARLPSTFLAVILGSNLLEGDIQSIVLVYAITFALIGIFVFAIKEYHKKKNPGEEIKIERL